MSKAVAVTCAKPSVVLGYEMVDGSRAVHLADGCTGKPLGRFTSDPTEYVASGLQEIATVRYGPSEHRLSSKVVNELGSVLALIVLVVMAWGLLRHRMRGGASGMQERAKELQR